MIPIEGRDVRIAWSARAPRTPQLAGDELLCGGPEEGLARRIERYLKRLALETMSREVAEFASAAGVAARQVSVGDAGSRWGSCSSQGKIRLSWRLILAPPEVRRYVVAHEVAHLAHLNHGRDFKALESRLLGPGVAEAKSTLRRVGPRLRRSAGANGSGWRGGGVGWGCAGGYWFDGRCCGGREGLVQLLLVRFAGAVRPDHRLCCGLPASGGGVPIGMPFSSTIGAMPFMS